MNGDIDVRGRRVVVIGAAVAGAAAAEVLALEGADVLVSEALPAEKLDTVPRLHQLGIEVAAGGHDPSHLDGAALVVTGPGVPQDAAILRWRSIEASRCGESSSLGLGSARSLTSPSRARTARPPRPG